MGAEMIDNDLTVISQLAAIRFNWSEDKRRSVVEAYETFLNSAVDNHDLRPSKDVDELWHLHILNSIAYIAYCNARFGHYVHHVACVDASTFKELEHKLQGQVPGFIKQLPVKVGLAQCGVGDVPDIAVGLAQCGAGETDPS